MKRIIILAGLLSALSFTSNAQTTSDWAPVGATWYYTETFFWPIPMIEDYLMIQSVGDTVIQGLSCRKLTKRHTIVCSDRPQVEYMYSEGQQVYFFDSAFNGFQMLYDFGAVPGDSWSIRLKDPNDPLDEDTLVVTVDSTDMATINGLPLNRLYVTYLFLNETIPNYSYNSVLIDRIGDTWYMFNYMPELGFVCDANMSQGLRCYEDSVVGHYETGIADSCTYIEFYDAVAENSGGTLRVHPNPVTHFLFLETSLSGNKTILVSDLQGRVLMRMETASNPVSLDLSDLPPQVYILRLKNGEHILHTRIIKQ